MSKYEDRWIKCIAQGGNIHATAITAAHLIEDARKRHHAGPVEIKALGEALMAGLLLASTCKSGERISLSIKGDKFLRQAVVDANPDGKVRGFVITRDIVGSIDQEKGPWQNGLLSVVRLKLNEKEPYIGTVPNVTGHLAKDVTFYLSQSEQIPSSVGLAVNLAEGDEKKMNGSLPIKSAGAFLVRVMPGATEKEIRTLEENINQMESLAAQIAQNADPTKLLSQIFNEMTFTILEERPLLFECNCSRERIVRALKLLGKKEVQEMLEQDKGAQVSCDFCGTAFKFGLQDLEKVLGEMS